MGDTLSIGGLDSLSVLAGSTRFALVTPVPRNAKARSLRLRLQVRWGTMSVPISVLNWFTKTSELVEEMSSGSSYQFSWKTGDAAAQDCPPWLSRGPARGVPGRQKLRDLASYPFKIVSNVLP